jgi:hypothetical protein
MTELFFGTPHAVLNVETLVLYFLLMFLSDYSWERHLYFEESHNTVVAYLKSKYREGYLNVKRMKWEKYLNCTGHSTVVGWYDFKEVCFGLAV